MTVVMMVMVTNHRCGQPENEGMPRRKGSFLAKFPYGGRERSASPPSGCKPRFAGFAVCTSAPPTRPSAETQSWRGLAGGAQAESEESTSDRKDGQGQGTQVVRTPRVGTE